MGEEKNGKNGNENPFKNILHTKKRRFLLAIANEVWTLAEAAEIAEIHITSHYFWMKDPDYAAAFRAAEEMRGNRLEDVVYQRAAKSSASDTLAIFLLKGQKPDKYRERVSSEISGPGGGPVQIRAEITQMTDEELDAELTKLTTGDTGSGG